MKKLAGIILIFFLVSSCFAVEDSDCELPLKWRGKWSFKEHPQTLVKIDTKSINLIDNDVLLGDCINRSEDHFIFQKEDNGMCTSCIFFQVLHENNILRYKKTSHCAEDNSDLPNRANSSISEICQDVHNEIGHMLIKRDFEPIPCPFKREPYFFRYAAGSGLERNELCEEPKSHVETCYDDTQLVFKYQGCHDKNTTVSKNEEIQCLGTFREGGKDFLIATVQNQGVKQFVDGRYRCFIYEKIENASIIPRRSDDINTLDPQGYKISQSEDASCDALKNTDEGIVTMVWYLNGGGVQTFCSFPDWFRTATWNSLDFNTNFRGGLKSSEIFFNKTSHHHDSSSYPKGKFICSETKEEAKEEGKESVTTVLAKLIDGCTAKDLCMTISKMSDSPIANVKLNYKTDSHSQSDFREECLGSYRNDIRPPHKEDASLTLVQEKANPVSFPLNGIFALSGFVRHKEFFYGNCTSKNPLRWNPDNLVAGCDEVDKTLVKFENELCKQYGDTDARCFGSWKIGNYSYFVLSFLEDSSEPHPLTYCFTYNNVNGEILVSGSTGHCIDQLDRWESATSFFSKFEGSCDMRKNKDLRIGSSSKAVSSCLQFLILISVSVFVIQ